MNWPLKMRQAAVTMTDIPHRERVLITDGTIAQARLTMLPLIEAQCKLVPTDDEPDSNPIQANMLAHAALLLHACKELNIDVTEALMASTYMVGVPPTTQDTIH